MTMAETMPPSAKPEEAINRNQDVRWCQLCATRGISTELKVFQLNLTEAVTLCPNRKCTYPVGASSPLLLQERDAFTLRSIKPKNEFTLDHLKRKRLTVNSHSTPQSLYTCSIPKIQRTADVLTDKKAQNAIVKPTYPPVFSFDDGASSVSNDSTPCSPVIRTSALVADSVGQNNHTEKPNCPVFTFDDAASNVSDDSYILDKLDLDTATTTNLRPLRKKYLHWRNQDALCWLDVAMCILVHSQAVRRLTFGKTSKDSLAARIIQEFDKVQVMMNNSSEKRVSLETSVGKVTVKTGGGQTPVRLPLPGITDSGSSIKLGLQTLNDVREQVWQRIQPKLRCQRGQNDSPVFALPLILRESAPLMGSCMVHYQWSMTCTDCGYEHSDSVTRCMPTFPNVTRDFNMTNPGFVRDCFVCPASNQVMKMEFKKLPPILLVHFVEGLNCPDYTRYDFDHEGKRYKVSSIIQYKTNPNHFVAWIRNISDDTWMKCDDMETGLVHSSRKAPSFPPSQVHIVMWELEVPMASNVTEHMGGSGLIPGVTTVSLSTPCTPVTRTTNSSRQLVSMATSSSHVAITPVTTISHQPDIQSTFFPSAPVVKDKIVSHPGKAASTPSSRTTTKVVKDRSTLATKMVLVPPVSNPEILPYKQASSCPTVKSPNITPPAGMKVIKLRIKSIRQKLPSQGSPESITKKAPQLKAAAYKGRAPGRPAPYPKPAGPPKAADVSAPALATSFIPADPNKNLSRMERIRLNVERLKSLNPANLTKQTTFQPKPSLVAPNQRVLGASHAKSNAAILMQSRTKPQPSPHLKALQHYLQPSSMLTQTTCPKFEAFQFGQSESQKPKTPKVNSVSAKRQPGAKMDGRNSKSPIPVVGLQKASAPQAPNVPLILSRVAQTVSNINKGKGKGVRGKSKSTGQNNSRLKSGQKCNPSPSGKDRKVAGNASKASTCSIPQAVIEKPAELNMPDVDQLLNISQPVVPPSLHVPEVLNNESLTLDDLDLDCLMTSNGLTTDLALNDDAENSVDFSNLDFNFDQFL